MGRSKTIRKRAQAGARSAEGGKAVGRPADLSAYAGTEDRDGTVQLPKPTAEATGRVIKSST